MALEPIPVYTGFRSGVAGLAYNEAAFGLFLSVERRRAEQSSRPVVLVLVSAQCTAGRRATIEPAAAGALFTRLGTAVREVDFVGWYREGRVAAAVLTQQTAPPDDVCERVADRVKRALSSGQLHADMPPLRVRVMCLRGKKAER